MRRILVACDLSAFSARVCERAALIAAREQASLTLMHVLDEQALSAFEKSPGAGKSRRSAPLERVQSRLETVAGGLRSRHAIPVECETTIGVPHRAIASSVAAHDVDLIVAGAHSGGRAMTSDLGATADRILRVTNTPLLVVRREDATPYREVLAAVDFSPASVKALRCALDLAVEARMTLFHVIHNALADFAALLGAGEDDLSWYWDEARATATARLEQLIRELPTRAAPVTQAVEIGRPATVILQFAKAAGIDLLATGRHGSVGFFDAAAGSVMRRLAQRIECDVLIAPAEERPETRTV